MITVSDILEFIESIAPSYMKEDWDRVGLNCGHLDAPVSKVLVALDPFEAVCREAKEFGAELLVTHHALIWNAGFVTDADPQGRNTLYLIENRIACINAHTNLDCAPGGVNDILAGKLELSNIQVIAPKGTDDTGRPWGLLRMGTVDRQPLSEFLRHVKHTLRCKGLRYIDYGRPVQKVAVGGGACAGYMKEAAAAGCDTFVTADIKYNQFWNAQELGINLIDAGHYHTENPVCSYLTDAIKAKFPSLDVKLSNTHTDPMNFWQE